jgi:hypothetical protein
MTCFNCKSEIPANSRFCLNCGVAQPLTPVEATPTPASATNSVKNSSLAVEGPSILAVGEQKQEHYGIGAGSFGCMRIAFYVFIGLLMLIPGVPLLAAFGIPLAIILLWLTYKDVGQLQGKIKRSFLHKLPGLSSGSSLILALSVFYYLLAGSVISIVIMLVQFGSGRTH